MAARAVRVGPAEQVAPEVTVVRRPRAASIRWKAPTVVAAELEAQVARAEPEGKSMLPLLRRTSRATSRWRLRAARPVQPVMAAAEEKAASEVVATARTARQDAAARGAPRATHPMLRR